MSMSYYPFGCRLSPTLPVVPPRVRKFKLPPSISWQQQIRSHYWDGNPAGSVGTFVIAKLLESSHAWLGASTSSIAGHPALLKLKAPTWTQSQLQEAIQAVVTQKMRFTQASTRYGIPKGTLYDNILGKTKRMVVLEEAGLTPNEENAVLDFCCQISLQPYNRRTKKSLGAVLGFVERLRRVRDPQFQFTGLAGFRWWWAFCKKHSIVSLFFERNDEPMIKIENSSYSKAQ
uniref:HTH psq-type domain-containing protein n=1 Tax=Timema poppense TaxID=170557 RepID=A0A7R9CUW9_TIMPO|nr:unnamed protein product [Timema poppensis]